MNTLIRGLDGITYWVIEDPEAIHDFVNTNSMNEWEAMQLAKEPVLQGEIVAIWGGDYISKEEMEVIKKMNSPDVYIQQIEEDVFEVWTKSRENTVKEILRTSTTTLAIQILGWKMK